MIGQRGEIMKRSVVKYLVQEGIDGGLVLNVNVLLDERRSNGLVDWRTDN